MNFKFQNSNFTWTGLFLPRGSDGLSLLGVLVALFLLSTGTLAVAQVLVRNQTTAGTAREQLVATALAREGLELARAQRDTNWFLIRDGSAIDGVPDGWMDGLCESGDGIVPYAIGVDADGIDIQESSAAQLWLSTDGRYTHREQLGSTAVPYRRVVRVDCTNHVPTDTGQQPFVITPEDRDRILGFLDENEDGEIPQDEYLVQFGVMLQALRSGAADGDTLAQLDFTNDGVLNASDVVLVINLVRAKADENNVIVVPEPGSPEPLAGDFPLAHTPAFVTITSHVEWESRGQVRDVTLTTRLYDWLRYEEL